MVFPVIVANCGGWVGYSMVELDPFVFVPNALGLLLGLFYTLSATRFADTQARPAQPLQHGLLSDAACLLAALCHVSYSRAP